MNERGEHTPATITTFGTGSARAVPDLVRVTISVESSAEEVATAYRRAGACTTAITTALRADGVGDADIGTGGLSVRAETVWEEGRGRRVTGYVASTDLAVTLRRDGTDPAAVVAHCVAAGGDDVRLGGLDLTLADRTPLLLAARDAAWDDAVAKAARYAERAGRALGPVLEITEDTASVAPMPRLRAVAAPLGGDPAPIEAGETEITATVRVTWRLA